jgi:hypothetical protein
MGASGRHQHTPEEEREIRENALDETIANSFPASDPPSSIPNPDQHDANPTRRESKEADQSDTDEPMRKTR